MMKKWLLVIILLFMLTGCIFQENTPEFKQLSSQFDQYQLKDIIDDQKFKVMLDDVTYQATISTLKLEIRVYTALGFLIETRYVSGFIFAEDQDFYYAMTDYLSTDVNQPYELWIEVTDYKNETYRGYLVTRTETLGLSAIRFAKNPLKLLKVPQFAQVMPYVGEPVILIGYVNRTNNGLRMGLVTGYELLSSDNSIMNTSIPSDAFANGAVILNIHAEIIGIQFQVLDGYARAYDIYQIKQMIEDIII
jgi:hypothetical protein